MKLKNILDFIDSYCKCQGKYGLDEPNRAELEHDIKKWALGLVDDCNKWWDGERDLLEIKEIKRKINEKE